MDINCRHPLGWTALHVAVVTRNMPVVRFLVEQGADVNSRDEFSSAGRVARQRRTSSDRGIYLPLPPSLPPFISLLSFSPPQPV